MRRALAGLALAFSVLVAVAVPEPPPAAGAATTASTQEAMNHAAVVVDTGDGVVRKMCLAFPEAELSGIEALRRVDTRPNRFETFSGKGSGVCMLCGVGCPSGDCFCDPSRYWAYHRAGPGESQYKTSSLGASSTVVKDGDVEAWKWGSGSAPPKTTVSEVCGVAEPPARTGSSATTTQQPTPSTDPGQDPSPTTTAATPSPAPTTAAGAPTQAPVATPTTSLSTGTPAPSGAVSEPINPDDLEEAAAPSAAAVKPSLAAEEATSAGPAKTDESRDRGQLATQAAFVALLGALVVWRARIRRAKVRRERAVQYP